MVKSFFKNYLDKKYPKWDITIALRYIPIVEDIRQSCRQGEKILEVGSEITGITPYLKMPVTGLDVDFDYSRQNQYLTPVKGSALNLPWEENSFEYVLSVDMLEHIPPQDRQKAVLEILRVFGKKAYISFPCGQEALKSDRELSSYYFQKHHKRYPYLEEHLKMGLPDFDEVRRVIRERGYRIRVLGNTNITLWTFLLKLGLSGEKFKSSLYRRILLLLPILKHFNFEPTYRKVVIIEKYE